MSLAVMVSPPARIARARQHALELADVARPAVLLQLSRGLVVDAANVAIQLRVDGADEVPNQQRQIVAALAQRRQVNRDQREDVVEIAPERSRRHRGDQIRGGRREHARAQSFGGVRAIGVAERADEARLQRQRHRLDVGEMQRADSRRRTSRFRAPTAARCNRHGSADRCAARAAVVQHRDRQALAGAGLADEQRRHVVLRQPPDHLVELEHRRGVADEVRLDRLAATSSVGFDGGTRGDAPGR